MRMVFFLFSLLLTIAFIMALDRPLGKVPPLGSFISPQQGFWQNAEPADYDFSADLIFPELDNSTTVCFDERLVPHVFSEEEKDIYFVQGFLHAKFRLWQMEFQTYAAGGRLTEILGAGPDSAYLNNDRNMRRLGMVYGAKRSLEEMEKDDATRTQMNAYTSGVNAYIAHLTTAALPLEYRLLNYLPEKWTNLKTALFLKYMSYDLTSATDDIEYTNAKSFFSEEDFHKLYPLMPDSLEPVIPKGTLFPAPQVNPVRPPSADSLYFQWKDSANISAVKTDKDNGSNNWVVAGNKTRSGKPILCNDPHLGLNLPSLWYEMQLSTPSFNTYGVSFPGAPYIIIGFNDSIAWGVTNAARDVRDYFDIHFKDATQGAYWYNNEWKASQLNIETYMMKGGGSFYDTVAYTVFGPVMYDAAYTGKAHTKKDVSLAVRWKAHEASNELRTFYLLNRAKNYTDYVEAIRTYKCPGQNFAFAAKSGDIALWQQGEFPAKWKGQGDFVLPGTDSFYNWQMNIPQQENPHVLNPARGFVSSANQVATDTAYPYYTGGIYDVYRGLVINRYLSGMSDITIQDMQKMQNDNYNVFAETALPFMLNNIRTEVLSDEEKEFLSIAATWNYRNDNHEQGPSVFTVWFGMLEQAVWNDELEKQPAPFVTPEPYTLIDALKKDSAFSFTDNINTPEKETVKDILTASFKKAVTSLLFAKKDGKLNWSAFKDAGVRHLLRMEPLSRYHLNTGGGLNVINATKQFQGPSWKMIVQLTDNTEAYGIYGGGQSGNPGSKYYDGFVDDWAAGKYYPLWMMKKEEMNDAKVKYTIRFSKQ